MLNILLNTSKYLQIYTYYSRHGILLALQSNLEFEYKTTTFSHNRGIS